MTLMEALSERLKRLQIEKGFTSYKIQKEGGVSRSNVGKLVLMKFKTVESDTLLSDSFYNGDNHKRIF